ncbi:MAG TPA: hypothetical protein VFK14_00080 [Solirubrobacterales bacterium]|nr:hypothetical protein [Solirubrobacterales bacterium]
MILAALLIFLLALALLPLKLVIGATAAVFGLAVLSLTSRRRVLERQRAWDLALFGSLPDQPEPRAIADADHPLWSFGARRGPDLPADHTLPGRFR